MNPLQEIQKKFSKINIPQIKVGDWIKVYQKVPREGKKGERLQVFEGLVIAQKHGQGLNGTFTVRKIATGEIGVEKTFPLHSPLVIKIEKIGSARVRKAKLYYLRKFLSKIPLKIKKERKVIVWEEPEAEAEIEEIKEELEAEALTKEKEKEEEIGRKEESPKVEND